MLFSFLNKNFACGVFLSAYYASRETILKKEKFKSFKKVIFEIWWKQFWLVFWLLQPGVQWKNFSEEASNFQRNVIFFQVAQSFSDWCYHICMDFPRTNIFVRKFFSKTLRITFGRFEREYTCWFCKSCTWRVQMVTSKTEKRVETFSSQPTFCYVSSDIEQKLVNYCCHICMPCVQMNELCN